MEKNNYAALAAEAIARAKSNNASIFFWGEEGTHLVEMDEVLWEKLEERLAQCADAESLKRALAEDYAILHQGGDDYAFVIIEYPWCKSMSLCEGRHEIPQAVDGAIFPNEVDPTDLNGLATIAAEKLVGVKELTLYVTGLTVALVEVIKHCQAHNIGLTLMHFNRATGIYYPQRVIAALPACPFCGKPWNPAEAAYCPHCGSC